MDIRIGDKVTYKYNGRITTVLIIDKSDINDLDSKIIEILKIERPKYEAVEEKEGLLKKEEREFLKQALKFGNYGSNTGNETVKFIRKSGYYICIYYDDWAGNTIYIDRNLYFKKLEEDKKYTLKELRTGGLVMEIEKLFNRAELRRLEKAARDKNKIKLAEWARQFEIQVDDFYKKEYQKILADSIDNFLIAITYTLHFNEKCRFGNGRIADFMDDLMAVVDGFKTGEYSPEEYKEELKKQKIYFD